MKRIATWIVCIAIPAIAVAPILVGDMEREELNDEIRAQLGGNFIELSDGFTHYELKGSEEAKTVVLVHGNAAPFVSWDNTVDALVQAGFRTLRYDLFGHGFSDRPELETFNRDLYDRQLVELLNELAISDPIHVVGTSQGASIGVYFAAQHNGRVERVAFLSPLFDSHEGTGGVALLKAPFIGEYLIRLVGDRSLIDPSGALFSDKKSNELERALREQIRFIGKKRAVLANLRGDALDDATEYYAVVGELGLPILLTWGNQDLSVSGDSMRRLRDLIPAIEYHEFQNAAHLVHYEQPDKINPVLIRFLQE